ncbi:hypothetical protein RCL_jg19258.t1 [Rhizophagus clarus]|uniref:Uncharacterized protein n=1 Tax=Rhizophagus clarus TaxID=94130 RepID=A0A8H3LZC1_9GLOM|nr:hypothetical protein RCL_jg19258.t1 [Rhizophagus clarus]
MNNYFVTALHDLNIFYIVRLPQISLNRLNANFDDYHHSKYFKFVTTSRMLIGVYKNIIILTTQDSLS